ncbi:hypothetical protein ACFQS1_37825 [Paractinoplanes rhizophilus]|uniref:Alpha/beta hydrolase n=1 Tax=Paractinoplanes rhizophilus TaxID=1416877 RepID=A0ABW2I4D2_9ACTN
MSLKRVGSAAAAVVVLLFAAYAGFLGHRARHAVSLAPPGPYPVGRAAQEVADRSRTDELAPVGGNPRVLSMWLWYPAASRGTPAAYAPGAWAGLRRYGWGQTAFSRIATGTFADVPFAAGTFPLVVLLPGLGFAAPQYQALAASIASRGYVVAGVTPTYSARLSVIGGHAVRASAAGTVSSGPGAARLAAVWAADARFAARQAGLLLGPHVHRAQVVYAGHGFGGAVAIEACRADPACAGAADLDGAPGGKVVSTGLRQPLLMLGSSLPPTGQSLLAAGGGRAWAYTIAGARSGDFTDYAAYWLAAPVRAVRPLGDPRVLAIAADYLAAFLPVAAGNATWRPPSIPGVREAGMLGR